MKNKISIPEAFYLLADNQDMLTHNSTLYNKKFDLYLYCTHIEISETDGSKIIHAVPDGDENEITFKLDLKNLYIFLP